MNFVAPAPPTPALSPWRGEGDIWLGSCSQGGGLLALPWANFLHPYRVLSVVDRTSE